MTMRIQLPSVVLKRAFLLRPLEEELGKLEIRLTEKDLQRAINMFKPKLRDDKFDSVA